MLLSTVYNANTYVDGVNWFGIAEELTLPDLKPTMQEHKALGMIGKIELPSGLDKMEFKMKMNSVYPEALKRVANFYDGTVVMARSSREVWEAGTKVGEEPVVIQMRGLPKSFPAIVLKHQDNPELESTFTCTMYKLEINGEVIVHVDLMAQIYIVDGVDMWAEKRANLGL